MKMRKVIIALLGTFASLIMTPSAQADSKVADCAEFRNPTSSASSTTITLKVDVYATCTEEQLGRGKGQSPLYSMLEEESLFNLSSCNGPSINALRVNGYLGTATCTLRVGTSTLPSSRAGATTTTIRMWFAWDFSTKTASVRHSAIPAPTNNGWGGSTSGSSGSSAQPSAPAVKNCVNAPEAPTLSLTWNDKGPFFKFSPAISGDKPTVINWSFVLYDSSKRQWDLWSAYKSIYPANVGEYQAIPEVNKSKIAFSVYATNACGSSDSVGEVEKDSVFPLEVSIQDEILSLTPTLNRVTVGDRLSIGQVANSKLKLNVSAVTSTPTTCRVSLGNILEILGIGECKLGFTSASSQNKVGALSKQVTLIVKGSPDRQSIPKIGLAKSYSLSLARVKLSETSSAGLPIYFQSLNQDVCEVEGGFLLLRSKGICDLILSQDGNEDFLAAENKFFITLIKDDNRVIICNKGKSIKKITGINPKCPSGYKKK